MLRNKLIRNPQRVRKKKKKRVEKVRKSDHRRAQSKQVYKGKVVRAAEEMLRNMIKIVTEENYN